MQQSHLTFIPACFFSGEFDIHALMENSCYFNLLPDCDSACFLIFQKCKVYLSLWKEKLTF
jgi:hypothetical protein